MSLVLSSLVTSVVPRHAGCRAGTSFAPRRCHLPAVVCSTSLEGSSLEGTSWRVTLNIGREAGTWMPDEWAKSGARLSVPLTVTFTDEPAVENTEFPLQAALLALVGTQAFFSLATAIAAAAPALPADVLGTALDAVVLAYCARGVASQAREGFRGESALDRASGVRRVECRGGSFVGSQGVVSVEPSGGAWTAAPLGRCGQRRLRFYLDFPVPVARNDVSLPAGRVFFSAVAWDGGQSEERDEAEAKVRAAPPPRLEPRSTPPSPPPSPSPLPHCPRWAPISRPSPARPPPAHRPPPRLPASPPAPQLRQIKLQLDDLSAELEGQAAERQGAGGVPAGRILSGAKNLGRDLQSSQRARELLDALELYRSMLPSPDLCVEGRGGVQVVREGQLVIKRNDLRNGYGALGDVFLILGKFGLAPLDLEEEGGLVRPLTAKSE